MKNKLLLFGFVTLTLHAFVVPARSANLPRVSTWANVNVKGSNIWFNLVELRAIADAKLKDRKPNYRGEKFEVTANIFTDDPVKLVMFQYFENFGLPVIRITIDKNGRVISYDEKIASETIPDADFIPKPK